MDGFTTYRRDRNINGGSIILYIRDDIPSTLLNTETSIDGLYVEINVRKKKLLIGCFYNPHSLKINRLRDTEGKNCQTRGSCQFLISFDCKKIFSYLLLLLISLYYFNVLHFFNNKVDMFQALR